MTHITLINLENASEEDVQNYRIRTAVRAIVLDKDGYIALLHASKNTYYKLPGGGVEKGEDFEEALRRECREEIGCEIEITGELGLIVEYRKEGALKQTSYCYRAKVIGEKGHPDLTQDEIDEGFEIAWLPPEEAIQKLISSQPQRYGGDYMVARDLAFLRAYLKNT